MENDIKLFNKTSAVLVYLPSETFKSRITKDTDFYDLYIHVDREYGSVTVYKDNDIKRIVNIDTELREHIQKLAEKDRQYSELIKSPELPKANSGDFLHYGDDTMSITVDVVLKEIESAS